MERWLVNWKVFHVAAVMVAMSVALTEERWDPREVEESVVLLDAKQVALTAVGKVAMRVA